ncbi:MAG: radical SAM (seleno)protein TrsS [Bacteroidales bacterium]
MKDGKFLYRTWSICPVCLKTLPAQRIRLGDEVYLKKSCSEHGPFESIIWKGLSEIEEWVGKADSPPVDDPKCPDSCGLCSDHLQRSCCVILNVTDHCNLNCRFCFADSGCGSDEPIFSELKESLIKLIEPGKTLVQLSGGEPTIRADLPQIIKAAKNAGAKYIQLNSNGIRLGESIEYVKELAEAGLSFVFMQFDATDDAVIEQLRGRPLLKIKKQAIENCSALNIGVTLVPTIVRDINLDKVGAILQFAISSVPKVRGVHFQPVTYIGRVPGTSDSNDHITLDELMSEIQKQTDGMIKTVNLLPSSCDHPLCGFHGDFVVDLRNIIPLLMRGNTPVQSCCNPTTAEKNREFVARRWQRPPVDEASSDSENCDLHDMEHFLNRVKTHGFTITAMAFQDAANLDFSRLRNCSLHVYDKGKFVPFCAYYITGWKR